MRIYIYIFLFAFAVTSYSLKAKQTIYFADSAGVIIDSCAYSNIIIDKNVTAIEFENNKPNPILQLIKKRQKKNKRVVAAILAFPFPFGIVGLHRIYLGTAPHVPVVYIGTFGGVIGILPFIDFCVLVLDKDFDRYINNKKVFMWVN